ncbi:hypothetical protein [Seohaeicola zhoushanensis]|uniref:Uncharacterized protein n=1 Tax=Seohaeicola zhoushanensis TaxID=1569283 RepID=A0A8J3M9T5_9RHOB|nr:hypothetical protein [Seohaeicola zhoushanensis]GHF70368.1 hypothetical protein GCM10017056_46720 [Seohaeicola zhoushanensis]
MALTSDAAMVLFYDFEGDTSDHDDWHSREHFHERLSVPGFLRATRFVAQDGGPRYLVLYEVEGLEVATSPGYLARLGAPTEWTRAVMPRFRGMVRGFASVVGSTGFGLGCAVRALTFTPRPGHEDEVSTHLRDEVLPRLAGQRGMAGCFLFRPAPPPPMTAEQALRGADRPLPWLLLLSAHDTEALDRVAPAWFSVSDIAGPEAEPETEGGTYVLHLTATAAEAARGPAPAGRGGL